MENQIWYRDISSLWKKPFDFFPVRRPGQSDNEFVNSVVRFVLYVSVILSVYTQRAVVLGYGAVVIAIVSLLARHREMKIAFDKRVSPRTYCRLPTRDNPYANALTDEFGSGEWTPCDGLEDEKMRLASMNTYTDLDDYPNINANERQFMTLPNAGYGPDFAGFSKELAKGSGIMD
jgi:hypothetical protein